MTKSYAVLQKKLQELESQLFDVFSLPAKTPCHELVSEGIKKRFLFLNNLLSTEIASHPSKPQHLHHIANRLTELETAFREWDEFRNSAVDNLETDSVCSCTESCLNDDGEALPPENFSRMGFTVYDVPEIFREAVVYDEKAPEETVEKVVSYGDIAKRDESKVAVLGKYIGALASGAMLGALMMGAAMVIFYDHSQIIVYGGHLPT